MEPRVQEPLDLIDAGIFSLNVETKAVLEDDDSPDTVVALLNSIRTLRKALADIESGVEATAVQRLAYGETQVGDLLVEVRSSRKRSEWRHDDLAWRVCQDLAFDSDGTEVDGWAQIVDKVRNRLLLCARPEWRMTPLKDLGIEPNDYCVAGESRKTVTITAAVTE